MSSMYKLSVRERTRGCSNAGAAWAALCGSLSSFADGAAALLTAAGALAALPGPLRSRLLPAVAHAASHHRTAFLQSRECTAGSLLNICLATRSTLIPFIFHQSSVLLVNRTSLFTSSFFSMLFTIVAK